MVVKVLKRVESWLIFHQVYVTGGVTVLYLLDIKYEAKFTWKIEFIIIHATWSKVDSQ